MGKSFITNSAIGFVALVACAFAASTANANVLVYEGFSLSDYAAGESINKKKAGNYSIGLDTTSGWNSGTGVFTSPSGTLSLPTSWAASSTVQGTQDYRCDFGTDTAFDTKQRRRAQQRALSCTWPQSGSIYFRFLMHVPKGLLTTSYLPNWGFILGGLGCHQIANATSDDPTCTVTNGVYMGYRNRNNTIETLAYVYADGGTLTSYPLFTIDTNKDLDAVFVAKIDIGGNGNDTLSLYATTLENWNDDFDWKETIPNIAIVSGSNPLRYLQMIGQYKTNKMRASLDEFIVTTDESKAYVHRAASAPVLGDVSLSRTGAATYSVTAEEATNSADLYWIADDGTSAPVTNLIQETVSAGSSANGTITNLAPNKTYQISVLSKNASGSDEKVAGIIYTGELALGATTDANEYGLVPGTVAVSRASGDPWPLTVNYTISGSVGTEGTTWAAPVAVTIPADATSASLPVVPMVDSTVTENIAVTVALAAGNYEIPASNSASLQILNVAAPAGYNTWMAPADGLASVGTNWSEGHAPTESENVLFDGYFSSANCEWDVDAPATVGSWTQNANYSGTVTFDTVYAGKGDFTVFTISGNAEVNGGVWTHPQSLTSTSKKENEAIQSGETYRLNVAVGGTFTLGANGKIDVTGKGEKQTAGYSPMPRHGGALDYTSFCYGNPKYPVDIGSAGWSGTDQAGKKAAGGGAVHLTVNGAAVVNGKILADGESKPYACGAGGSILVEAPSVSGTGTIRAGYTYATGNANSVRTGAGGRVALLTTDAVDLSSLWVSAAAYATGGSAGSGGTGTVYLKDSTMTHGVLIVDNPKEPTLRDVQPRTGVTAEGDWTFDELRIGGWSQLFILGNTALHLPNGLSSVTALSNAVATSTGFYLTGGTLDMGETADQTMDGGWQLSVVSNLVFSGNLALSNGAMLGKYKRGLNIDNNVDVITYPAALCSISVAGNMSVDASSSLSVVESGFLQNSAYYFPGYGTSAHGGCYGDTASLTNGAVAYGSILNPLLPSRAQRNSYFQPGGGALKLTVGGTFALAGQINADGHSDGNSGVRGAGGSINIAAGALTGAGSIHANGYSAESGGRVAVRLTNSDATFDDFTGTITARRDGESKTAPGTVYLQTAADGEGCGTIIVDGSLRSGTASSLATPYTPIPANGAHADDPADLKKCSLVVSNYARVGIAQTLRLASLEVDSTSVVDLCGKTLTVKSAKLGDTALSPGTYTASDEVVEGILADSGVGGELVVTGGAFFIIVR